MTYRSRSPVTLVAIGSRARTGDDITQPSHRELNTGGTKHRAAEASAAGGHGSRGRSLDGARRPVFSRPHEPDEPASLIYTAGLMSERAALRLAVNVSLTTPAYKARWTTQPARTRDLRPASRLRTCRAVQVTASPAGSPGELGSHRLKGAGGAVFVDEGERCNDLGPAHGAVCREVSMQVGGKASGIDRVELHVGN